MESAAVGRQEIPGLTGVDPSVRAAEEAARHQLKRQAQGPHVLGSALGIMGGGAIGHIVGSAIEDYVAVRAAGPSGDANAMGLMDLLALKREDEEASADTAEPAAEPAPSTQLADPWVDLPPPSIEDQISGTEFDPWAAKDSAGNPAFDPWAARDQAATSPYDPWAVPASGSEDPWATGGGPWSQASSKATDEPERDGPRKGQDR